MTMVADYSNMEQPIFLPALCTVGIFGTEYVRDEVIEETLKIQSGAIQSLQIPHINSALEIGNTLAINMRQRLGSELDFVFITEQETYSEVTINASGLQTGDQYTLYLESFDTNGGVYSALKTDTILI